MKSCLFYLSRESTSTICQQLHTTQAWLNYIWSSTLLRCALFITPVSSIKLTSGTHSKYHQHAYCITYFSITLPNTSYNPSVLSSNSFCVSTMSDVAEQIDGCLGNGLVGWGVHTLDHCHTIIKFTY